MAITWGVADPDQLAELSKLIDAYSREMGIEGDTAARDRLAELVMALFNEGVKPGDMRPRLDSSRATI